MRELTSIFDYFVLATGTSRRQLHAMSEEIDHALEDRMGDRRLGIEGYEESRWILLDYGDVVIHLFEPETRAYYALEELWGRAKNVPRPSRADGPAAEQPARFDVGRISKSVSETWTDLEIRPTTLVSLSRCNA